MSKEQSQDYNFCIFIFNSSELDESDWYYNLPSLPKLGVPLDLFRVKYTTICQIFLLNTESRLIVIGQNFIEEASWLVGFKKQNQE